MTDTIAIIAMGEMGSAVGGVLQRGGARVITSLAGRSAASVARAERNGVMPVESDDELIAQSAFVLSIVPPGEAATVAQRLAPALARAKRKPIYADCNAIAPATALAIGTIIATTGCSYGDAGIIGGPPNPGVRGTKFYVSGDAASATARLSQYGLDIRTLDAPAGAASALKMSYAGLTKGFTGLGAAMMLAASRAGAADALRSELMESRPEFLPYLNRNVPTMFPKAYRWVAEMEEIAAFTGDAAAAEIYEGMAALFQRLAKTVAEKRQPEDEIATLERFCNAPAPVHKTA